MSRKGCTRASPRCIFTPGRTAFETASGSGYKPLHRSPVLHPTVGGVCPATDDLRAVDAGAGQPDARRGETHAHHGSHHDGRPLGMAHPAGGGGPAHRTAAPDRRPGALRAERGGARPGSARAPPAHPTDPTTHHHNPAAREPGFVTEHWSAIQAALAASASGKAATAFQSFFGALPSLAEVEAMITTGPFRAEDVPL